MWELIEGLEKEGQGELRKEKFCISLNFPGLPGFGIMECRHHAFRLYTPPLSAMLCKAVSHLWSTAPCGCIWRRCWIVCPRSGWLGNQWCGAGGVPSKLRSRVVTCRVIGQTVCTFLLDEGWSSVVVCRHFCKVVGYWGWAAKNAATACCGRWSGSKCGDAWADNRGGVQLNDGQGF